MKTIFLIGYMGCGKTTLGRALANELGVPFIDLDDYIEEQCECRIADIFAQQGEKTFRELERQALRQMVSTEGGIVACGGGTPCHSDNMEWMNSNGITIWLTTSPERITSRLILPEQKAKRPLIADLSNDEILNQVEQALMAREPYYNQAHLQFDSTWLESAGQIKATAQSLAEILQTIL
ncbi:MAG: shikimate kinase [Muribaculaceae bacterium]|nr:shikimate kinase [Muribaculaceae bacterium]